MPYLNHRRPITVLVAALNLLAFAASGEAQTGANVLVVINAGSTASETVAREYAARRGVPQDNMCAIRVPAVETVSRTVYDAQIERPIWTCISTKQAHDRILYIVLTKGVPIRIAGTSGRAGTSSSVDSELTLLYRRRTGQQTPITGFVPNPYFAATAPVENLAPFTHQSQDIYLVTRLDGYTVKDALDLIKRGSTPRADGRFVFTAQGATDPVPDQWFRAAAQRLTSQGLGDQVAFDGASARPPDGSQAQGYYAWSWSEVDPAQLPGALVGLFVSTDAGTFKGSMPAPNLEGALARTSQSLMAELVGAGVLGAAVTVNEPFLDGTIRPDILFPAYASGRNLAEAFYAAMPYLSWQTVVVGDPLSAPFPHLPLTATQIDPPVDAATELPAFYASRLIATLAKVLSRDVATAFTRFQSRSLRNDMAGARQDLEAAIAADPNFTPARMQLALLKDQAGDWDGASVQYRAILSVTPNDGPALNNLAYLIAVPQNDPLQALPLAERAVLVARLGPNAQPRTFANYSMLGYDAPELLVPYSLDTLAWVMHLLGRDAEAVNTIREARATGAGSPEILWHAAVIFAAVNDTPHAVAELSAAMAGDPRLVNRTEVQKLREQLNAAAALAAR